MLQRRRWRRRRRRRRRSMRSWQTAPLSSKWRLTTGDKSLCCFWKFIIFNLFSAACDEKLPKARELAGQGKLTEALDMLMALEKQTRCFWGILDIIIWAPQLCPRISGFWFPTLLSGQERTLTARGGCSSLSYSFPLKRATGLVCLLGTGVWKWESKFSRTLKPQVSHNTRLHWRHSWHILLKPNLHIINNIRFEREDHRPGEEALPAEAGRGQDGHRGLHILGQNTRQGINSVYSFDLEKLIYGKKQQTKIKHECCQATMMKLIDTLRTVTAGKIYVENERARLTHRWLVFSV